MQRSFSLHETSELSLLQNSRRTYKDARLLRLFMRDPRRIPHVPDQKANHASARYTRARGSIRPRRDFRLAHIMRVIRIPRPCDPRSRYPFPAQSDSHRLSARARIDDDHGDASICIGERAALQIRASRSTNAHSARTHDAELRESPEALGDLVVLAVDEDQLLVVIVVGCAVLDAFPKDIGGEIAVDDAVEDGVGPGEAVAGAAALVPRCAPAAVQVRVLRLPDARFCAHGARDAARVFVARDGVDHAEGAGAVDLARVLRGNAPACGFAAVDADVGHVVFVEGWAEYFDEFGGLGA